MNCALNKRIEDICAWSAFLVLLVTYWLTVAPTVSYWDCPEYVSAAYLLEIGHPPGNPLWMLVERIVTMLAPSPEYVPLAVNLSSGLFMALAGLFLARVIFMLAIWVLQPLSSKGLNPSLLAGAASLCGALAFGWCDSAWYSAVEAEVYAMSTFMTALCLWLMMKWSVTYDGPRSWRLLILIAYLFGLSIGIHQLNLLCIPALAAIWTLKRNIRTPWKLIVIFLLSLAAVGFVLLGVMPGSIAVAAQCELFAVNHLGLPLLSGIWIFLLGLGGILIFLLTVTAVIYKRTLSVWMRRFNMLLWMFSMLLVGYSAYALIPIRGWIPSQANPAMPGEPFSFASYQARDQYGSAPLFYGPTPYSRPMYQELYENGNTTPSYYRYALDRSKPIVVPYESDARIADPLGLLSHRDSAMIAEAQVEDRDRYLVRGYKFNVITTPELNMFLPRITGRTPSDIAGYESWIGMTQDRMKRVPVSEAFDSLGHAVTRLNDRGERGEAYGYRPTYMQNIEWLASYQVGYMYMRYLMWNFSGRQNDIPSQGEVQHGNFITGITPIDNLMLGAEDHMPAEAGSENPGHNRYWMIPFILGIIGIIWLMGAGRRGRRADIVIAILFVMTGLAIVVYLNQGPGQARERDYSFLGSFMAFAIWIGFGAIALARACRSYWALLLPVATVAWMCAENYDDHDRSHRYVAHEVTAALMETLEPNAIVFVDGDNYTFPYWYMQEVQGIRPDVRFVNVSYLRVPQYAANLKKEWRESAPLPGHLQRSDLIWGALQFARVGTSRDTIPATTLLEALRSADDVTTASRYAWIQTGRGDSIAYDLRSLSISGSSSSIDVGRLILFDIVATNAASEHPRPVYWMRNIRSSGHIRIAPLLSPWLYGEKFGVETDVMHTDSLLYADVLKVRHPNRGYEHVYMDRTPASQIAAQRFLMMMTGRRLLSHGHIAEAEETARRADLLLGEHPESYRHFSVDDSVYNVRISLADLLRDVADSIVRHPDAVSAEIRSRAPELRHRSEILRAREQEKSRAWDEYRRSLPPRLRRNMAPTD